MWVCARLCACVYKDNELLGSLRCDNDTLLCVANRFSVLVFPSELIVEGMELISLVLSTSYQSSNPCLLSLRQLLRPFCVEVSTIVLFIYGIYSSKTATQINKHIFIYFYCCKLAFLLKQYEI